MFDQRKNVCPCALSLVDKMFLNISCSSLVIKPRSKASGWGIIIYFSLKVLVNKSEVQTVGSLTQQDVDM